MNKVLLLVAALAALALSGPAFAQEAPEGAPADDEGAAAPAGDVSDDTATEAEKALEEDLDLFWGKRREVKVVQKRLYEKDGRIELSLPTLSIVPNDDFIVYYPIGGRVGYHFSEAFMVEASFSYAIQVESDLAGFLEGEGIGLKRADIQEKINFYYNIDLLWAPIYGKISLLGLKLTHFETYVGLGFGIFHNTEFPASNPDGNEVVKPSGNTVLGFRWFINDNFNIRTEYRQFFFQKFQGGVSIPVELSLGLGIII